MKRISLINNYSNIELFQLFHDKKIFVYLVFLVFSYQFIVRPFNQAAMNTGKNFSMPEIFLALSNSGWIMVILPLVFLILISDFPMNNSNTYIFVSKTGRRNWCISELLFILKFEAVYIISTFIMTSLFGLKYGKLRFCWSDMTSRYSEYEDSSEVNVLKELISGKLYNQMPLMHCLLLTCALLLLYLFMLSCIFLLFFINNKRTAGLITTIFIVFLGPVLAAVKTKYMWLLPYAHTSLTLHYTEYFRKPVASVGISFIYFAFIDIILTVNILMQANYYSFMNKEN
jgi:hypothetical protein